jgi:hypothetical protein
MFSPPGCYAQTSPIPGSNFISPFASGSTSAFPLKSKIMEDSLIGGRTINKMDWVDAYSSIRQTLVGEVYQRPLD